MKKIRHIISFHYRRYFSKKQSPSYEEKRAIINSFANRFSTEVFVETGTFRGDTVEYFKDKFRQVYSIELSEELAAKAAKRFEADSNVQILQGDSGKILQSLVQKINRPSLYWLDGHYSSEFFIGDEYFVTAKGEKDTPVLSELQTLLADKHSHVILIDDARLFTGQNDYPSVAELKKIVSRASHPYSFSIAKDIIQIIPVQ